MISTAPASTSTPFWCGSRAGDAGKGKEWERDLEAKYVVQEGDLKDLSLRVRYATARGFAGDIDELRVITEYPLDIL